MKEMKFTYTALIPEAFYKAFKHVSTHSNFAGTFCFIEASPGEFEITYQEETAKLLILVGMKYASNILNNNTVIK